VGLRNILLPDVVLWLWVLLPDVGLCCCMLMSTKIEEEVGCRGVEKGGVVLV
jgi:hypothetical protein